MFCHKQGQLIEAVAAASSRYYDATTRLAMIAGRSLRANFVNAQHDCKVCLEDCHRARTALQAHKVAHGC